MINRFFGRKIRNFIDINSRSNAGKNFFSSDKEVQEAEEQVPASSSFEERYKTFDIEKYAKLDYMTRPNLPHMDPTDPSFIPCERTDFLESFTRNSHNYLIDRLKADLAMQKHVHSVLNRLDRPYLRGIPGNDKNITGGLKDYHPGENVGYPQRKEEWENEVLAQYRNEDRWINQTIFTPKFATMTHYDVEWPKEISNRPVNSHFHADKGYKYDVAIPYDERYEFQADRLGHPEILGTPAERLFRLEGEMYHPAYLSQPFVKLPKVSAHPSLNFEVGETIYENPRIPDWGKFWGLSVFGTVAWIALFVPYNLCIKTHLPTEGGVDNLFYPYFEHNYMWFDYNSGHVPVVSGALLYSMYIVTAYVHNSIRDYVVRATYSRDKELLFVTRVSPYGSTEEEVYETQHLESLPPYLRSGLDYLSAQDDNGLVTVQCMNTQRELVFYQEDKYWNPKFKNEFRKATSNYWTSDVAGLNRYEKNEEEERQWNEILNEPLAISNK